jgi:hypothetical protein
MSFNVFIHLLLYPIDVGAVVAVIVWFSNFSAISCREQVHFQWDDDDDELDFYSVSLLKQQSADRHVAPLGHIILIPSQTVFAAACLA